SGPAGEGPRRYGCRQFCEVLAHPRDGWIRGQPTFIASDRLPNLEKQEFLRPADYFQSFRVVTPRIPRVLKSDRRGRFRWRRPVEVKNGAIHWAYKRGHVLVSPRVWRVAAFAHEFRVEGTV